MALTLRDEGTLAGADSRAPVHVACLLSMAVGTDGCDVYEVADVLGARRWLRLHELPLEEFKAKAGEAAWKCTSPSMAHGNMIVPCWSVERMPHICVCGAPSVHQACAKVEGTRTYYRHVTHGWVTSTWTSDDIHA